MPPSEPTGAVLGKASYAHGGMGGILRTGRECGRGSDETPRELCSTMTERSLEEITVGIGSFGRPRGRPKKLTSSPSKPRPRGRPSLDIRKDPDRHAVVVTQALQSVYAICERHASLAARNWLGRLSVPTINLPSASMKRPACRAFLDLLFISFRATKSFAP